MVGNDVVHDVADGDHAQHRFAINLLQQLAQQAAQGQQQMMPGVGGVPTEMQGGMTPEMMGMGVGQGGEAAPGMFRDAVGNPMGEDEEMDAMAQLAMLRRQG